MAEGRQHTISDAGRRMSEAVTEALQAGGVGRFLAILLETGAWDRAIYDTKADAVRLTDESKYAYVCVPPTGMPPAEATHWIALHRKIWESGFRMTDPGGPSPIPDLGPTMPGPRPGRRPSGLVVPSTPARRTR